MKKLLLILLSFGLVGCATAPSQGPTVTATPEEKAHQAAAWVADKSGLLEVAVAGITQATVYATEENSQERAHTIEAVHALASNLNALVSSGKTDPDSILQALRVKEQYVGSIIGGVSPIVSHYILLFQKNGYGDLTVEIVKSISKGMADGSAQ